MLGDRGLSYLHEKQTVISVSKNLYFFVIGHVSVEEITVSPENLFALESIVKSISGVEMKLL